jgi:rod shape-determining protein MreC
MRDNRRTRTILGLLLLTSLTLVILNLRGGGDSARDSAGGFFGPVQSAVSAVVKPVSDFFGSIGSLGSKDQQITDLQAQIDELQQQLNTTDFDRNRARELDELLGLAGRGQYEIVPAQVVATGPAQGFGWTVTIDAGRRDGVKVDQNVVNGQGLVGRVIRVNDSTSVVELQLLDPFAPVQKGDRLVSFGFDGGVYVAGIPLGTITEVRGTPGQLTRIATVVPFVDVTRLDLVGVIVQPPRTDPRDSVLPPKPTASPTPEPSASSAPAASPSPSAS